MGLLHYFLGIEVKQEEEFIKISQQRYAKSLLDKFHMRQSNPLSTPMEFGLKLSKDCREAEVDSSLYRSLVGSLMYLTATRPDMAFAVSIINRFMDNPKASHWEAGKRILKYVQGTISDWIIYSKVKDFKLVGYSNSDFGGRWKEHSLIYLQYGFRGCVLAIKKTKCGRIIFCRSRIHSPVNCRVSSSMVNVNIGRT